VEPGPPFMKESRNCRRRHAESAYFFELRGRKVVAGQDHNAGDNAARARPKPLHGVEEAVGTLADDTRDVRDHVDPHDQCRRGAHSMPGFIRHFCMTVVRSTVCAW
jgi:hypothetical protein